VRLTGYCGVLSKCDFVAGVNVQTGDEVAVKLVSGV